MSAIPPNWLSSIIQSQGATNRAADARRQDEAAQSESRGDQFVESRENMIEEADADSEVYADAEGAGSMGRPFGDGDEAAADEEGDGNSTGRADGGLDVTA